MLSYPQLPWSAQDLPELLRAAIEKYRDQADDLRRIPPSFSISCVPTARSASTRRAS
jgi:hypothetical protein